MLYLKNDIISSILICCGLQIRAVEEQLKQRVIGERYCINRKKEVTQKKY